MSTTSLVSYWLPCPVVFISTAHGKKRDIMTATAMFVSEKEPLVAVSIAKEHLTAKLIKNSGQFALVIASEYQEDLVWEVGSVSGEEDKFRKFSITTLPTEPGMPLVPANAASWMQCRMVTRHEADGNWVIIARVVEQRDLGHPPIVWHKNALFKLMAL